jgi:hypothetical protein
MMTKNELAFEQVKMRERWANRPSKSRPAKPKRVSSARVAPPELRPVALATRRNQHQETLALGFSLGVPPVRAGYSAADIEYACVCGVFSNNPTRCLRCGRKRSGR